ncbi:MAG: type II secretion system F family protein [Candidatus Margulisbacteria bacterium]|nr:type II secretion system F family protein [Candidatus Margulisiibacteriota bacterium]
MILYIGKAGLSLPEQKDLFQFLYLYYKEGTNAYYILDNYKNVVKKSRKPLIKRVLGLLKKGSSFSDALLSGSLIGSNARLYLFIAKETGNMETAIEDIYEMLSNKIVEHNKMLSKIFYPATLSLLVIILIPVFSTIIIPQISNYYKYYQLKTPLLLVLFYPSNLLIIIFAIFVIGTFGFFMFKRNKAMVMKLPLIKSIMFRHFQKSLFTIYQASIKYHISFDYLIDKYNEVQNNFHESYLFSTLSLLIKQGKGLPEAMESMAILKKYKPIFSQQVENTKKISIIEKMIKELNLNEEEHYDRLANLIVLLIMLVIGGIVFMFGYIMLSPLQQIINVI